MSVNLLKIEKIIFSDELTISVAALGLFWLRVSKPDFVPQSTLI